MIINIGNNVYVDSNKIKLVMGTDTAPSKKMIDDLKGKGKIFDATANKRRRSLIVLNDDLSFLSILKPETIFKRIKSGEEEE